MLSLIKMAADRHLRGHVLDWEAVGSVWTLGKGWGAEGSGVIVESGGVRGLEVMRVKVETASGDEKERAVATLSLAADRDVAIYAFLELVSK